MKKMFPPLLLILCPVVFAWGVSAPSRRQTPDTAAEQAFLKLIQEQGVKKARQVFDEARRRDSRAVLFSEAALNALGYKFLYERKQLEDAIAIFQLNVEAYPASANVYDSLAEAYLGQGRKDLAERNYRKSLELNPRNGNAIQMLARILAPLPKDGWEDRSSHRSDFVTVNGVRLHYLDWGGRGDTLLLLTGMGNSAHIYDDLAPQFTDRFRVLALTRRGHGQSDKPRTGYDTETLVEDIAQFLDALKIERAHLAGHSLAGDELTLFAGRYPERVGKLVYLDAANDRSTLTDQDIFNRIPEVFALLTPSLADVASYQTYRDWVRKKQYGFWSAAQEADFRETRFGADGELKPALPNYVVNALNQSTRLAHPDYGKLRAPALSFHALYSMATAFPWLAPDDDRETLRKAREFLHLTLIPHQRKQAERFGREVMGGRVIVWPATHHYLFITRRAEVRRAMWDFLRRK
jgi:pimeloyl-ACP methyl ester carboxylesterase